MFLKSESIVMFLGIDVTFKRRCRPIMEVSLKRAILIGVKSVKPHISKEVYFSFLDWNMFEVEKLLDQSSTRNNRVCYVGDFNDGECKAGIPFNVSVCCWNGHTLLDRNTKKARLAVGRATVRRHKPDHRPHRNPGRDTKLFGAVFSVCFTPPCGHI